MAAFTTFSEEALERYLIMFGKGELHSFEAIESGIENSNYFLTLLKDGGKTDYVLTIIETLSFAEVPFFSKVMTHLKHYGLSVAAPEATLDGMTSTIFSGKPTFLFKKLAGKHLNKASAGHCHTIGEFVARSQQALTELKVSRENPYDVSWLESAIEKHSNRLTPAEQIQVSALLDEARALSEQPLPAGLIHGDLFMDNALFDGDTLTGVIDFYHTCHDSYVQDLAITINDWCQAGGRIDGALKSAMLKGYQSVRSLTPEESEALIPMQRTSALRFAMTRLESGDPPLKDPSAMLSLAATL